MLLSSLLQSNPARALLSAGLLAFTACSSPADKTDATTDATIAADSTATTNKKAPAGLQLVAELQGPQFVGVAVVPDGRMFIVSPRWDYNPTNPLAIISTDGSVEPYPDAAWCTWNEAVRNEPQKHWICPQSVFADPSGMLWVLDAAAPGLKLTVPGGPKLVKIDPTTNKVLQNISFPEAVLPRKAYLNDVRVDTTRNVAYITESGEGSLLVVDLKTGKPRRVLVKHKSMLGDSTLNIKADGQTLVDATGKKMQFNADGIALSHNFEYLYWKPLTSYNLYRIKTEALRNEKLTDAALAGQIEDLGNVPACDGMEIDANDNVYLTAFETNSIVRRTAAGKLERIVTDKRLQWPDTFAFAADGSLYVTTSAIHKTPNWNQGVSKQDQPFHVFKVALPK